MIIWFNQFSQRSNQMLIIERRADCYISRLFLIIILSKQVISAGAFHLGSMGQDKFHIISI